MTTEEPLVVFDALIQEAAPRLTCLGLEQISRTSELPENAAGTTILFQNRNGNRQVSITAYAMKYCSIFILPLPDNNEGKKFIELSRYLSWRGNPTLKLLEDRMALAGGRLPAQEYFQEFLDIALQCLETDLRPVVEGRSWEEVPIDWARLGR